MYSAQFAVRAFLRQRMFDHARAFCEAIYGEKVDMDGIHADTMTCLALESLPLPVYDIMSA